MFLVEYLAQSMVYSAHSEWIMKWRSWTLQRSLFRSAVQIPLGNSCTLNASKSHHQSYPLISYLYVNVLVPASMFVKKSFMPSTFPYLVYLISENLTCTPENTNDAAIMPSSETTPQFYAYNLC